MKPITVLGIVAIAVAVSISSVDANATFCYHAGQPCATWLTGECATGQSQSPIDLNKTQSSIEYFSIFFSDEYKSAIESPEFVNNGHTVQYSVNQNATSNRTVTIKTVNNQTKTYIFGQLHLHWGSEHTIGGEQKSIEMHVVHFRNDFKNISAAQASGESDALLVLGVLMEAKKNHAGNPDFESIVHNLPEVSKADPTVFKSADVPLNFYKLLPVAESNLIFNIYDVAIYNGSLTTPTCNQIVYWVVMTKTVTISEEQLEAFPQNLKDDENDPLEGNNRPIQNLNGRTVKYVKLAERVPLILHFDVTFSALGILQRIASFIVSKFL